MSTGGRRWRRRPGNPVTPISTPRTPVPANEPDQLRDRFDALRELAGPLEEFFAAQPEDFIAAIEAFMAAVWSLRVAAHGEVGLWIEDTAHDLDQAFAALKRVMDRLERPC